MSEQIDAEKVLAEQYCIKCGTDLDGYVLPSVEVENRELKERIAELEWVIDAAVSNERCQGCSMQHHNDGCGCCDCIVGGIMAKMKALSQKGGGDGE